MQLFNDEELTLLTRAVNSGVNVTEQVEQYVGKFGGEFLSKPNLRSDFLSVIQGS
ncbi:hypothetical protein JCM19233_252 [Vibrio astriarenae]|nr:hypothetical protein JCM19233_252 [Vibrio sp. C7]